MSTVPTPEERKTETPSVQEAREIATRFINRHFGNAGEKPHASIPADPLRDDDIRLMAFIDWASTLAIQYEQARVLPLDEHTKFILGYMAIDCRPLAEMLRAEGVEIPRKIEAEQATVLHWMLGYYLKHGATWREEAGKYVAAHIAARTPTAEGGQK